MIQQNSSNPQQTKPHLIFLKPHPSIPKDLKQTIKSHLHSHKKLILSIEPLPNPSGNYHSSLLAPSGHPLKIEIHKKNSPPKPTQYRPQPFNLKAPSPPKKDKILVIRPRNHDSAHKENLPPKTDQNYPQGNYLETAPLSIQDLEVPLKPLNNPQNRVPKTRPQKKSSKPLRYKSPPFVRFTSSSFRKRDPDLPTIPLKEEFSISTVRVGSGFNKRLPLQNPQNTSYIGAVLECLYHLPNAKNLLFLDESSQKYPSTDQLKLLLKDFFHLMDTSSAEFINQAAWKITQYLFSNPTHQVFRDCVQAFKTLTEELAFNDLIPYRLLPDDNDDFRPLKQLENLHMIEIPMEEYIESLSENVSFESKYLQNLQDFPQIIAIVIKPSSKRRAVIPKFTAYSTNGEMRNYEFHAGVLEVQREPSNRSLAIIQCNGKGGSYFKFKDNSVKKVQLNEKFYIPRLIFYRSEFLLLCLNLLLL